MDIIKEINSLPNYYYEFDNPPRFAILGGHSCRKVEHYDRVTIAKVRRWFDEMNRLYTKESLQIEDKQAIAKNASKIGNNCDEKLETLFTKQQVLDFINSLCQEDKDKLEQQINRYKTAREYYSQYVHNQ